MLHILTIVTVNYAWLHAINPQPKPNPSNYMLLISTEIYNYTVTMTP